MSLVEKRISIIMGGGWVVTNDKATTYYDKDGHEYNHIDLGHTALYSQDEAERVLRDNSNPNAVQLRYLQFEVQSLAPSEVEPF